MHVRITGLSSFSPDNKAEASIGVEVETKEDEHPQVVVTEGKVLIKKWRDNY